MLTYGTGLVVSIVGILTMVGWHTHTSFLIQLNSTYTPMQYNTALCFLMSGLGLIIYLKMPKLSAILGGFIFFISATTLAQYIFSINLGLDEFFLKPYILTNTTYPGRMAPNTALYFSLLGFILCLHSRSFSSRNIQLLRVTIALFVGLAGVIGLLGYLFDISIAYGWGSWAQMAIHTSFCFSIIGFSLGIIIWYESHLDEMSQDFFLPSIPILGSILFIFLWQVLVQNEHYAVIEKSKEHAQTVELLLTDRLNEYFLALKRFENRFSREQYASASLLAKDANQYLLNMPALTGLMITGKTLKAPPLLLQMQRSYPKHLMESCVSLHQQKSLQSNALIFMSPSQMGYFCLVSPVSEQQLFVALLNMSQLAGNLIEKSVDANNYVVQLVFNDQVIYRSDSEDQTYQHTLGAILPVVFKNLSFQLHSWPTESIVKSNQSWLPIISLFTGLFVTFLLTFVVHIYQSLRQKEKKFRLVLNTTSDAIIIVNHDGKVILINKAGLLLFEYTEDEILGMAVEALMPERFRKMHEMQRLTYMKTPVTREMAVNGNIAILTKYGKEIPVEVGLNPLEVNFEPCVLCSIHNMRTAKENEEQLTRHSQTLQTILDISNAIITQTNFNVGLQRCLTIICTNFQWPIGHVYLVDESNPEQLNPSEIWFLKDAEKVLSFHDTTMKTILSYGIGLPGQALASNDIVWIDDVSLAKNFPRAPAAKANNIHAAFAFPIAVGGKIKGIFEFFSHEWKKEEPNLLSIIHILKAQMSNFLENQAIQDINKNLVTRFKFAVGSGKIGVWEYDPVSDKLIWDRQMYRLYGIDYQIKNLNYLTWKNKLHPDDQEKASKALHQTIKEGKVVDTEFRIIKPNGDIRHIQTNAEAIYSTDGSNKIIFGVSRDMTKEKELTKELEQLNAKLLEQAYYDALTGLMNRHALNNEAPRLLSLAKRHHYQLGVLYIDLDNFKLINDTFGHNVGDELLVEVTKRLRAVLRNEDVICRMGGDEFLIVLCNTKATAALVTAQKIVASIAQPFLIASHEVLIGASIGISIYPQSGEKFIDLLNHADNALLQAKNAGKGRVHVFKDPL